MSDFDDLEALSFEQIYITVDVLPLDRVTRLPVPDFITSGPRLFTEAGDTPASTGYKSVMMSGWKTTRRLTSPGKFLGPSTFNLASLVLSNRPPEKGLPGPLDPWLTQDWNDRPITVRAGGRVTAAGLPYPFSSYETIWDGVTDDLIPRADGSLELILVGRAKALSKPVVEELYRGFGGAARTPTGASALFLPFFTPSSPQSDAFDAFQTTGVTAEFFGVITSLPPTGELASLGRHSAEWGTDVDEDGAIQFFHPGGEIIFPFIVTPGAPLVASVSVAPVSGGYSITLLAGRDGRDIKSFDGGTIPTLGFNDSGTWVYVRHGGGAPMDIWEARLWSGPRTADEIINAADSPIVDAAAEPDLVEVWKFGDGSGALARGEKGFDDLGMINELIFASSLEGDDPVQFPGGPIGQEKPRVLGPAFNVLLANVDSQGLVYQWSLRDSADLLRVKSQGGPLFPDETVTTAGVGEVTWDDVLKVLTIVSGGHTFKRFVPGQPDPFQVTGQRVTISNDATYAGAYRVDEQVVTAGVFISGISADGLKMSLLDDATGLPPSLPTGDLASGAEIRTTDSDRQFTYDLATSTVRTTLLTGDLTADVTGELIGSKLSKLSEVFEILIGEAPDVSELLFDPPLGIAFAKGAKVSVKSVLDQIAFSGVASWVEGRAGGFRLATFAVPGTGTPKATIAGSPLAELGDEFTAPIIGRIRSIKPIPTKIPAWRLSTGYDRTWHVQNADSLIGALTPAARARLSEPYRFAIRTVAAVRGTAANPGTYPTSDPLAPFLTYLLTLQDAEQYLDLAVPLYTVKPRWYACEVAGLALFALEPGDLIWLQWPDTTFGIVTPVRARILALTEDTTRDTVTLEAFASE